MYFIPVVCVFLAIGIFVLTAVHVLGYWPFGYFERERVRPGLLIAAFGVIVALSWGAGYSMVTIDEKMCRETAKLAQTKYKRDFTLGCFLESDGRYIQIDHYRELYGRSP